MLKSLNEVVMPRRLYRRFSALSLIILLQVKILNADEPLSPNTLTTQEVAEGWQLLFDGKSMSEWRGIHRETIPDCWQIVNGELVLSFSVIQECGDLITKQKFADFDLYWEWKMLEKGCNSGLKYYVQEELSSGNSGIGLEYQLLDDGGHELILLGRMSPNDYHSLAALYEIYPTSNKTVRPLGEWNSSRIYSHERRIEHWLNGEKVMQCVRGSRDFHKRVANSKFSVFPSFGEAESGYILLQQHGGVIAFRSIKIHPLGK